MTTSSAIEFIDTTLFSVPSILSYNDPKQKTLIRNHILALINDFPTFEPSSDTFFHFDGTSTYILNVSGLVHVSKFLSDVPIIIWLHENYPIEAPTVHILSSSDNPVHEYHPFIDNSGVIAPSYVNWHEKCDLCTLVHSLVNLFLHDHPSMPSSIVKVTVLDDLVVKICNDVATMNAINVEDIEKRSLTQDELRKRGDHVDVEISNLLLERENLERRVNEMRLYNDKLSKWLEENMGSIDHLKKLTFKEAFESVDEISKAILENKAMEGALEDVMCALDKGLMEGVLEFDVYLRQVRIIARLEFYCKALLVKLETNVNVAS